MSTESLDNSVEKKEKKIRKLSFTTLALIVHDKTPSEWYIQTERGGVYRILLWCGNDFVPDLVGHYVSPCNKLIGGCSANYANRGFTKIRNKKQLAQLLLSH